MMDLVRLDAEMTKTGLTLPPNLSFDEWQECGRQLGVMEQAVQWWVGDWIRYGELKYGEKYAQAIEATGLANQTLMNAVWVCSRIETSRRRENLSFAHHAEVAALSPAEQEPILEAASRDQWKRQDVRLAVRNYKRALGHPTPPEADTCSVADLAELVSRGTSFGTIYADPPWLYSNQATRAATGNHYSGLTVEEIKALPVAALAAENAHLHLWTTNAFMFECRDIMQAWGFEYKSCFVWCKPQIGIGNYWRVSHEFMLLGVRGSLPFRDHAQRSWQEWDRTQHSQKPYPMYDIIESVSPGPYLELFARRQQPGWVSWGNEIERDLFFEEAS